MWIEGGREGRREGEGEREGGRERKRDSVCVRECVCVRACVPPLAGIPIPNQGSVKGCVRAFLSTISHLGQCRQICSRNGLGYACNFRVSKEAPLDRQPPNG